VNLKFNRRGFLRFAGGGALGLATSGASLRGLSELNAALAAEEINVPRGPETWALSVCSLCPGACGLRVRKIGNRAVKIIGNPLHPVNRGGLCPRGVAGLQVLYHPDRLHTPQKNIASRAAPRWKEISWDEAIQTVSERLRMLGNHQRAHAAVFVGGHSGHLRQRLFRRFLDALGSPNYLRAPDGLDSSQFAAFLQQGVPSGLAYDFEAARYLLSFGINLLEGWGAPVGIMRAFGHWRDAAAGRRTKFVQIEPRLSITAARADEWVACRTGTEAALALGIAYVLITEGLYDARFVSEHTFGFEDWRDAGGRSHLGFRSLVLGEYRVNQVAALTQVPAETILRLGREFGRNRPALAIGGSASSTLPGDPYTAMAVHSLNALVGSVDRPGGMLVRPVLPGDQELEPASGKRATPNTIVGDGRLLPWLDLTRLPDAIRDAKPYPVEVLFIHGTDPAFSLPNGEDFAQALERVPFVVSFSSFWDETSAHADLVLPDHTDLEKWQEAGPPPSFPTPVMSLSPPVVTPLHQTRDTADVLLDIAHALGGPVAERLPYRTFEEFLREHVKQVFAAQAGYTFTTSLEETWNRLLARSGWWAPSYANDEQLWEQMKEQGGWWEPTYYYEEWDRVLRTPSRRFEFFSQSLARWVVQHREETKAMGLDPDDDRLCLPHQPPLPEASQEFPLLLIPVEVLPLAGSSGGHLPYMQQIAGSHLFEHWQSWLEMNPRTAAALGLTDREQVWIESRRGRIQARLRFYEGVRPGVVHLPLGYGQRQGSIWARRGVNPLSLLESKWGPPMGSLQAMPTYVRVYRS